MRGTPPVPPASCSLQWNYGDDPDMWIWDRYNNQIYRDGLRGKCYDLRETAFKTYSEEKVLSEIGVLATIGLVPNDYIAFGPNFPKDLQDKLVAAIEAQFKDDAMKALWSAPQF